MRTTTTPGVTKTRDNTSQALVSIFIYVYILYTNEIIHIYYVYDNDIDNDHSTP